MNAPRLIPWIIVVAVAGFVLSRRRRANRPATPSLPTGLPGFLSSEVGLIAAREVRQRVQGRVFRVVTVLMLVGVGAAIVIPAATKNKAETVHVGVVGVLTPPEQAAVTAAGSAVGTRVVLTPETDSAAASQDLRAGRITVALVGVHQVVTKDPATAGSSSTTARLARAVAASLGEEQAFQAAGLTAAQAAQLGSSGPVPLTSLQPAASGTARTASVIGLILLFVILSQYNAWTMLGVMEEKASRVVEVLLATVRPGRLLAGKVLGIGLLVFAQAGLVVAFALVLAAAVGSSLLQGSTPKTAVMAMVWLVLGYAFYSWVYAALGSLAERQDQVQSLALLAAAPMVVGYVVALTAASSGTASPFFEVLAYLPPTAPFAMPVLVGLGMATWWQVTVSAAISVVCTVGVARLAAFIYRRAALRTGRRVRLREVFSRQPA